MTISIASWILAICLDASLICVRGAQTPTVKYYETGKSCYIEGVFYESCPKRN
jgi:hypothetical protein